VSSLPVALPGCLCPLAGLSTRRATRKTNNKIKTIASP